MPKVVGLRFRTSPKMYWFAPVGDDGEYVKGAQVVVETQRGTEIATVVMPVQEVDESKIVAPLKSVMRIATEAEVAAVGIDAAQKREIMSIAKQKVAERGLDMKIADCEYTVDRSKLVLYFTAEQRVDFRELVRDLASAFHMRIDLRQIGARDECKLIGALGSCGMPCCCGGFESDAAHVSIKMAKNQGLALTPNKINGICGRLLCCLGYENATYDDVLKRAPKHGAIVTAPDGRRGSVVSVTPLTETVRVRFGNDESFEFAEFPMSELSYERRVEEEKKDAAPAAGKNSKQKNKNKFNGNNQNNGNRDKNNAQRNDAHDKPDGNGGKNGNGGNSQNKARNGKRFDKKKKGGGRSEDNDNKSV